MAIHLQKGQTINLEKKVNDLSRVTIGLGWRVKEKPKGFFATLFGGREDYDLDAIAILLDSNDKIRNFGDRLRGGDVVFFNSQKHPSGTVWSLGDNLVGGDGRGDDEQIMCLLDKVPPEYAKIVFLVSIYKGQERGQRFGEVEGAYIRAVDARGTEIARFSLSNDPSAADAQTVIFAELYRHDGDWKFRAIGDARRTESFVDVLPAYIN